MLGFVSPVVQIKRSILCKPAFSHQTELLTFKYLLNFVAHQAGAYDRAAIEHFGRFARLNL